MPLRIGIIPVKNRIRAVVMAPPIEGFEVSYFYGLNIVANWPKAINAPRITANLAKPAQIIGPL